MRKFVDKMVVLAKEGGEHSRRQVRLTMPDDHLISQA